jgi:hypothetical protein
LEPRKYLGQFPKESFVNGETLGDKPRFEIGDRIKGIFRPLEPFPAFGSRNDLLHPLEIWQVVGFEAEFAARK